MATNSCPNRVRPIVNQVQVGYDYSYNPGQPNISVWGTTNTVVTDVVNIYTEKTANKTRVIVGDTIVYTVNIVNNSTVTVNNLFFLDTVPEGTSFVTDSFTVVGYGPITGANPNYGVDLTTVVGTLAPGASSAVTFTVQFNQMSCPRQIMNSANVYYNY
jgi:uncharacterized repeat protein (TIGR01451 family)